MYRQMDARALAPEIVAETAAPIFDAWGIGRAWLYGPVSRGTQRSDSDVDLAVREAIELLRALALAVGM